jgi:hypothetical protein
LTRPPVSKFALQERDVCRHRGGGDRRKNKQGEDDESRPHGGLDANSSGALHRGPGCMSARECVQQSE